MVEQDDTHSEAYFQGQQVETTSESGTGPIAVTEKSEEGSTEGNPPREASSAKEQTDQAAKVASDKQTMDWEKSYKELEKKYTKDSQRRAQIEKEYQAILPQYKQSKALADKIQQDQEAQKYLQQRWTQAQQPQVDPTLQSDPLYQYLQPVVQEVQQFKQFMNQQQEQVRLSEANQFLDKQIETATKSFEEYLGAKPTEEDIIQIYSYMAENQVFNGKTAVRDLFFDRAAEMKSQKVLESQQVKKNMGTTKVTSMNSNSAKQKSDGKAMSFRDAWKAAKEELGA